MRNLVNIPARHGLSMTLALMLPIVLVASAFGSSNHTPERWDRIRDVVSVPVELRSNLPVLVSPSPESASGSATVQTSGAAGQSNVSLASFVQRSDAYAVALFEVKLLYRYGNVSADLKTFIGDDVTESKGIAGLGLVATYTLSSQWNVFGGVGALVSANQKVNVNNAGLIIGFSGPIDILSLFNL